MKKVAFLAIITVIMIMACSKKDDSAPVNPPAINSVTITVNANWPSTANITNSNITISYPGVWASAETRYFNGNSATITFTGDSATQILGKSGSYQLNYSSNKTLNPSSGDTKTIATTQKNNSLAWDFAIENTNVKITTNLVVPSGYTLGQAWIKGWDVNNNSLGLYEISAGSCTTILPDSLTSKLLSHSVTWELIFLPALCQVQPDRYQTIVMQLENNLTYTLGPCN